MNPAKRDETIILLANDALEAAGEKGADAAMLLVDAALSLMVTRLGALGAHEMTGWFAEYIIRQGEEILARHSPKEGRA